MENSTAGLTAYVILSLFDGKVDVPDSVQTNAKYCIRGQVNPDKYSIAISSYALFKVKWISEARRFLEKAFAVVNREDGLMWWTAKGKKEKQNRKGYLLRVTEGFVLGFKVIMIPWRLILK